MLSPQNKWGDSENLPGVAAETQVHQTLTFPGELCKCSAPAFPRSRMAEHLCRREFAPLLALIEEFRRRRVDR